MAKIKIKDFAEKYGKDEKQVYNLIYQQKKNGNKIAVKVPGEGTLIDESKYLKLTA